MDQSLSSAIVVIAAFLLAGFVKGGIGMGLPTVAMGLLALAMPPAKAAALLVVPSLVTNVWQMAAGPALAPLLRRLWPTMAGIVAGTLGGSLIVLVDDSGRAAAALGAVLILYALLGLTPIRYSVSRRSEVWLGPLTGVATGIVTAATGVFVLPAIVYYQAIGLEKEDLVQTLGLSFTVSTLALAALLAGEGIFQGEIAVASMLALGPALLGLFAGQWLRLRLSAVVFRRWFFIGLLALGVHLVLRQVF